MRWGQKGRHCRWIIHLIRRGQKKLSLSAINYGLCASAGICDCPGGVCQPFIHPAGPDPIPVVGTSESR